MYRFVTDDGRNPALFQTLLKLYCKLSYFESLYHNFRIIPSIVYILELYGTFYFGSPRYINLMSPAAAVAHEFRREVSTGRAAVLEAASRFFDLHHQHRLESSGGGL